MRGRGCDWLEGGGGGSVMINALFGYKIYPQDSRLYMFDACIYGWDRFSTRTLLLDYYP